MKEFIAKKSTRIFTCVVVVMTLAPLCLNLLGMDFSARIPSFAPEISEVDRLHLALHGSLVHSVLDWAAVFTALFTTCLALVNFHVNRDSVVLTIATALLCAGVMDAFHIMNATRLIHASIDPVNFGPFSWALSRLFTALILVLFASVVIFRKAGRVSETRRGILGILLVMATLAGLSVAYSTASRVLPDTMYPANFIKRPYDLFALVLYATIVPAVLIKIFQLSPGMFAFSLLVSMVPQVGAQIYMVIGSGAMFDNGFNAAHYLKVLSYGVPFAGICVQYVQSLRSERNAVEGMIESQKMAFLGQLSSGAAHEINNPLTVVRGLNEVLEHKAKTNKLNNVDVIRITALINQHSNRIVRIIDSLKILSGEMSGPGYRPILIKDLIENTLDLIRERAGKHGVFIDVDGFSEDIAVAGNQSDLIQVLLNLIQNSLDALSEVDDGQIKLSVYRNLNAQVAVSIEDNGPGVRKEHINKIFTPFFTTRDVGKGVGLGLGSAQKIARQHGGDLIFERYSPGVKVTLLLPRLDLPESVKPATEELVQVG